MNKSKLVLAASFFSTALMTGALVTASANAAPLVKPQAQIAKIVKADNIQEVGGRGRHRHGFRGHRGHRHGFHRHWRPGRWCRNHPRRCWGHHPVRPWRHYYYGYYGYGVPVGGPLCHRHAFPVLGMQFHARIRCNHRHYRAYRSWFWVR